MQKVTIVIHGGAGTIDRNEMSAELEKAYLEGLQNALNIGYGILEKGGSAVDAVKEAVIVLEDNILFNAGRGSVFTNKGDHEMDAAIMDGKTLDAGAVAGVKGVRNPIALATQILLNSDHILLSGEGAIDFAKKQGIPLEEDAYFYSQFRFDQLEAIKDSDTFSLDHSSINTNTLKEKKFGTVGAVACDANGNVAAATSTGGMTNKKYGRIGDTPLIGLGTYANNATCAVSCTGHGEKFIQAVVAYDVSALMEYKQLDLEEASREVVMNKLVKIEGEGGLIAVDAEGNFSMTFNSAGMYRGVKTNDGKNEVAIYK